MQDVEKRRLIHFKGFSLVEIAVTMAVMGVVALSVMPYTARFANSAKANEELNQPLTILISARNLARSKQHCVKVEKMSSTLLRRTEYECPTATTTTTTILSTQDYTFSKITLTGFNKVTYTTTEPVTATEITVDYLEFNSRGGLTVTAEHLLYASHPEFGTKKYKILPAIGAVRRL